LIFSKEGNSADAQRLIEEAIRHQLKAHQAVPSNPTYSERLCNHYKSLADAALRAKDYPKAAEAAARLLEIRPNIADDRYRAARVLGRCADLAKHDPTLSDARRSELVKSYVDQAVPTLQEAVGLGFSNVAPLKTSSAFDALRGRPEFQQIIERLTFPGRQGQP